MKQRIKLKHSLFFKINTKNKIAFICILIFMTVLLVFYYLNKRINPILLNYAELETTKLSTLIINKAVQSQVSQEINVEDMIITTLNSKGEIITVDFDTKLINQSLNSITNTVQANLKLLEEGKLDLLDIPSHSLSYDTENLSNGIIYYIPFGVITNVPILAEIGPKIPVKTSLIGSVISNVKTEISNYGINNALLKIYIEVKVSEQVILPFISKRVTTKLDVPILIKIIQGNIPQVYGGMFTATSPLITKNIE